MSLGPGRQVDVDGLRTFVDVQGEGLPVLLVHGSGPGNYGHFAWRTVLPALREHAQAILVDVPGYGNSDPLAVPDTPLNAGLHLLRLMDVLGHERFAVMGHSRGGRIACELAAEAGDRVSSLVISGSGSAVPGGHRSSDGGFTQAALDLVNFGADGDTSYETFVRVRRTSVHSPASMKEEWLRESYDWFVGSGALERYIAHMKDVDPLNFYHAGDLDRFGDRLRVLDLPTLIMWGREDRISDYRRIPALLDVLPRAELHILPSAGHSVMFDQPERYNAIVLDFLVGARQRTVAPTGGKLA